jgi:hypothetical protein
MYRNQPTATWKDVVRTRKLMGVKKMWDWPDPYLMYPSAVYNVPCKRYRRPQEPVINPYVFPS